MVRRTGSEVYRSLNHYRLLVRLGAGGMGEVWAARDLSAPGRRYVALKLTKHEGVEAAKMLWDEARIASLIRHPNVCPVHEFGQAEETQYLVMDWIDGVNLHDLLQKIPGHRLSLPIAAWVIAQVAAGLHAAHELVDREGKSLGVVHRDVSPQNVLISSRGSVFVTDFGVAKAAGQAHTPTETGEVKGKVAYMAPEQVKSKAVDRRADVFSLGCLLYSATTGQRPFQGDDALATLYQILEKTVEPPSVLEPAYPATLERILLKALSKEPEERFGSAEELRVALEGWLADEDARVTEQDVAALLREHLGETIRERRALIAERDREAEVAAHGDESEARSLSGRRFRARESSSVATAVVTREAPREEPWTVLERRGGAAALWGALGLSAAVALVGVLAWRFSAHEESRVRVWPVSSSEPTSNGVAPRPTSHPTSVDDAQPDSVRVRITVKPPSSELVLDGKVVGVGSYEGFVLTASTPRELEVRAPGHRSVRRHLTFDRNQEVHLELLPVASEAAEAHRPPAPTSGRASVAVAPRSTPSTPVAMSAPLPETKPQAPRPIDAANPFESPR